MGTWASSTIGNHLIAGSTDPRKMSAGWSRPAGVGHDGAVPPRIPSLRQPAIGFAHRGARSHAAENTIEAFKLALRLGASGLESDAWVTADGVVVLDHDGVIGGRFRRRSIAALAAKQLPAHIPTLAQLYDECGQDFHLSLDVKDPAACPAILDVARTAGALAEERLWLCHPDWELVATWRHLTEAAYLVDSTRLSRLTDGPERRAAQLRAAGIDAVNLHASDWNGGLVTLFHRFERYALAWDAQLPRILTELLDAGVDGVFCDHVDRMVEAVARVHGP